MTDTSPTVSDHQTEPRLEPINQPESLKLKLAYWYIKYTMGKVITPMKVHYARFPESLPLAQKIAATEEKIALDDRLKHLIKVYVATLNGCSFCIDIGKASAQKQEVDTAPFDDLLRFEESTHFTAAEKAALGYVQEATQDKDVKEETFNRLRNHFSEREIVQITLLNAIENFYNLMNAPLNIGSDELCQLWSSNRNST